MAAKGCLHVANRFVTTWDKLKDGSHVVGHGALVFPHPHTFLKVLQLSEFSLNFGHCMLESWGCQNGGLEMGMAWKDTREKVALLRSYCPTQMVDTSKVAAEDMQKLESTWTLNGKTRGHRIEGSFAMPIEIADQLGDGDEKVVGNGNRKEVVGNWNRKEGTTTAQVPGNRGEGTTTAQVPVVFVKDASAAQSGHTDGADEDAALRPSFIGFVAPVTDDSTLRVWDCSHDVARYLHDAGHDDMVFRSMEDEEAAADYLESRAPAGSMLNRGDKIPAKTKRIPKGSSMAFLPSFMHAGSPISHLATRMSYRCHVYGLLKGDRGFAHGGAYHAHALLRQCCDKSEGGDHYI